MISEPVAALPRVSIPPLDLISYLRNLLIDVEVHVLHSPYQLSSLNLSTVRRNVIVIYFPDATETEISFGDSLEAAGDT